MSRYDRDESPDEIRDSTLRRPAERSGGEETSDARGQGGGSGTDGQAGPREIRGEHPTPSTRNREPREPNPTRARTYDLRDSEVQTLVDIGTFRAIKTEDLVQYRYDGDARRARGDLKHLVEEGLVQRRTTYPNRDVYVGLTPRAVAISSTIGLRMPHPARSFITVSLSAGRPATTPQSIGSTSAKAKESHAKEAGLTASFWILN